jgi:hypothetical protein
MIIDEKAALQSDQYSVSKEQCENHGDAFHSLSPNESHRRTPILSVQTEMGAFPVFWVHYASWHAILREASTR